MSTPMIADLHRAVGRIEGKIDTFLEQMKTQDDRSTDMEARLRKVENKQHWYSGVAALAGALLGYFGVHLSKA